MAKNHILRIRVTKAQKERIRENAEAKGFTTISAYLRSLALGGDTLLERRILAIYNKLFEVEQG